MREKDFQKGLTHIDDSLLEEAANYTKPAARRSRKSLYGLVAAACLCIAVVGGVSIHNLSPETETSSYMQGNDITMYHTASSYEEIYDALREVNYNIDYGVVYDAEIASEDMSAMSEDSTMQNPKDYSTTNVVTEGVDEADIVKTDGNFIYAVNGGSVDITDIRNGKPAGTTSLTLPTRSPADKVLELYVNDGVLIAITSSYSDGIETTYCYTYDISNPESPSLRGTSSQTGSYYTSRLIGDKVYVLTNPSANRPDMKKRVALWDKSLPSWIPCVNEEPLTCDCILINENPTSATLITSFSTDDPSRTIDKKCYFNGYAQVYVSADNMYLYGADYTGTREVTNIIKIALKDGKLVEKESTSLSGTVRDAFALNEKDGYLRVLTTDFDTEDTNILYVLDDKMKLTGRIDGIARGEEIYAARYVGDLVYFITYKNTDPLFVCDLSDPAAPKLLGSLEVEGFSEYLHMWDDTHLLGIGYGTDGEENGIMLTMFDVSDPLNPVVTSQVEVGKNARSNAVSYEYKAILVDPARGIIGYPIYEYDEAYTDHNYYTLYSYSTDAGFTQLKKEPLAHEHSGYRGLYSGDNFYVVGGGEVLYSKIKEIE